MDRFRALLVLVGTAVGLLAGQSAAAQTLRLCFEAADVRPWRTSDGTGLNFELIDAAAKRARLKVSYLPLPWKRCLAELKANAVDGAIGASFKSDRLALGRYPGGDVADVEKRLHLDTYVLVRRQGSAVSWDGKVLQGLRSPVGIQLGYSVREQLEALKVAIDDGSATARELLLKLDAGRLDAAALLSSEASALLRSDPQLAAHLELLSPVLVEKPYYVMLSHRLLETQPAVAARFWNAIEAARNSPEYRRLERQTREGREP